MGVGFIDGNSSSTGTITDADIPGTIARDTEVAAAIASHSTLTGNGNHIPAAGIVDANVATNAAIAWAKLSKSGAVASDVGAVPVSHTTTYGSGSHIPTAGIVDTNVAASAAIAWTKIDKTGASASDVSATPASHATDFNNPHGVTAAQAGALPASATVTINTSDGISGGGSLALNGGSLSLSMPATIPSDRTFSGNVAINGSLSASSLDRATSGILNVGATNASTLNLGAEATTINVGTGSSVTTINIGTNNQDTVNIFGSIVNIGGIVTNVQTANLEVTDSSFTLNKGGTAGSAIASGMLVEEGGSITGYFRVANNRNSFEFKVPNKSGLIRLSPSASAFVHDIVSTNTAARTLTLPDADLDFSNQAANLVFASPSGSSGAALFRAIVSNDIAGAIAVTKGGTGLTSIVADRILYTSSSNTLAATGISSLGRTLIDGANASAMQSTLALVPGTNVQAYSAELGGLAALSSTGLVQRTGANTYTAANLTVPSGFSASGATISYAAGQTANRVLATPDGTTGALSLRALVAGDIPSLSYLPLSGGTISGNLTINQKLSIPGNTSQNSAEFGSFGIQGYAVNNCWLGDNLYFNSAYYRRATGKASFLQFFNGTILMRCEETSDVADSAISAVTAMTVAETYVQMGVPLLNNNLTTTQRDALTTVVNGMLIYNTTIGKLQGRVAGAWEDLQTSLNGWSISETFLSAGVGAYCTASTANSGVIYLPYQFTPTFLAFSGLSSSSRQGFVTLETLTATNSRSVLIGPALNFNSGANVEFTSDVYIRSPQSDATNRYAVIVGFSNLLASDADDGIYFSFDNTISDYWQIRTANDSVANTSQKTTTTTSVLGAVDTWISFKIVVTGVTSAAFYINNSLVGTITTHLPAATRMTHLQWRILRSAGTNARRIIIDKFDLKYEIV